MAATAKVGLPQRLARHALTKNSALSTSAAVSFAGDKLCEYVVPFMEGQRRVDLSPFVLRCTFIGRGALAGPTHPKKLEQVILNPVAGVGLQLLDQLL